MTNKQVYKKEKKKNLKKIPQLEMKSKLVYDVQKPIRMKCEKWSMECKTASQSKKEKKKFIKIIRK